MVHFSKTYNILAFNLFFHNYQIIYTLLARQYWSILNLYSILSRSVFAFIFFHQLARKTNLVQISIYSNNFFHNLHFYESSFTCSGLREHKDCLFYLIFNTAKKNSDWKKSTWISHLYNFLWKILFVVNIN